PLIWEKQRLPRKVFRRSIAGRSDSLSTLRRAGCPAATQDSLPAVGQTLLGGRFTRRVPMKGFRGVLVTSRPPFPSLLGAVPSTASMVWGTQLPRFLRRAHTKATSYFIGQDSRSSSMTRL